MNLFDALTEVTSNDILFLYPISWDTYESSLKILGINSNSFNGKDFEDAFTKKEHGRIIGSRSSLARLLKEMRDRSKEVSAIKTYYEDRNELNGFTLGASDNSTDFLKESAHLTVFLIDAILRKIDIKLGLHTNRESYDLNSLTKTYGSTIIQLMDKSINLIYRTYPMSEGTIDSYSPIVEMVQFYNGGPISNKCNFYTFSLEVVNGNIVFNFYICKLDFSDDALESPFDFRAKFVTDSKNWSCFQFLINPEKSSSCILRENSNLAKNQNISILEYTKMERREHLVNMHGEDFVKEHEDDMASYEDNYDESIENQEIKPGVDSGDKNTEKQMVGFLDLRESISEYDILNFYNKLNTKQINFLQSLIDLKRK